MDKLYINNESQGGKFICKCAEITYVYKYNRNTRNIYIFFFLNLENYISSFFFIKSKLAKILKHLFKSKCLKRPSKWESDVPLFAKESVAIDFLSADDDST